MGILKNNYFGCPSGRIGGLIYRNLNGKTIVYPYSKKFKAPQSEKAKELRRKFGLFSGLYMAMNKAAILRSAWGAAKTAGKTIRERQYKINYGLFGPGEDISNIKLVPQKAIFNFFILELLFEENLLNIKAELSSGVSFISEKCYPEIALQGIMVLYDPAGSKDYPVIYLPIASSGIQFKKGVPLNFQTILLGEDLESFKKYPAKKFLFNLVIKSKTGESAYFSENVSGIWQ